MSRVFQWQMLLIATLLGVPWLGHGRKIEGTLATVCLLYGLALLFVPGAPYDSQATRDVAIEGWGRFLAFPFLLQAMLGGYGLMANIMAWRFSRVLRLFGALLGAFIWAWIAFKFMTTGRPLTFGTVCAVVFWADSVRVIGMVLAGLPAPGAPGSR
jgi:hypothetical protein